MNLYMILSNYFPMLHSIKCFHSVKNDFFNKGIFSEKKPPNKSDFMSFSLKRCIQACQLSLIYLKVRMWFKRGNTHRRTYYHIASEGKRPAPSWVGSISMIPLSRLSVTQQSDKDIWPFNFQQDSSNSALPLFLPSPWYSFNQVRATQLHLPDQN